MDCRSCLRVSMWNFRVSFLSPTQQYFHTVALFKTQSLTIYTFPAMESTWWNACYVVVSRRWVYHFRLLLCSLGLLQSIHPPQFPVCCAKLQVPLLGGLHTTFDSRKPYRTSSPTLFHYRPQTLQSSSRKSFKYSTIVSRGLKREWSRKVDNPWHSNGIECLVRSLQVCTVGWYCDLNMHIDCTHILPHCCWQFYNQTDNQTDSWDQTINGKTTIRLPTWLYRIYYNVFTQYWPNIVQIYVRTHNSNPTFTCPRPTTWKEGKLQNKKKNKTGSHKSYLRVSEWMHAHIGNIWA